MATTTTTTTGGALRRARELAELSLGGAARRLGESTSTLRSWESDRATPDEFQLDKMIRLYGAELNDVWPDRTPLVDESDPETLVVGDERIDLRVDEHGLRPDNRTILVQYLAAVRRQRGVAPDASVELRGADLVALSTVLDLDDRRLESTLAELLDLTPTGSRFTLRALVVGSLMAVGAGTLVAGSWFAPGGTSDVSASPTVPERTAVEQVVETGPEVSAQAITQFAPEHEPAPTEDASRSPFSVVPNEPAAEVEVELAPAVFAVHPNTEWTPVQEDELFSVDPADGAPGELADDDPAALGRGPRGLPPAPSS
jgi:transcriptional regulator with XRE-family HTH domain